MGTGNHFRGATVFVGADMLGMTTFLLGLGVAASPYLPSLGYLVVVTVLVCVTGRVPAWVHLCAVAMGLPVRVLVSGLGEPLLTCSAALVVFAAMVLVASRTVSGVSLFVIVTGLALTPLQAWPGLVCGLLAAAVVAVVRTVRAAGAQRVWWLTQDTLLGVGISTTGGFKRPQPEHIPSREVLMGDGAPGAGRMYLPPYLLAGVVAATVLAVLSG